MNKYKRVFVIVIDSLGIGEMADSKEYGDIDVDTLGHIARSVETFNIPNMRKMGISNLHKIAHVEKIENPLGYQMKMREASVGKDTMTGHWEMMGLHITKPFKTFTETGFPQDLLDELSAKTGHKIVGNKSASGTEILDELGEHQMKTGDMIVYTSADSVLQICGHEETFGLDELYRCCEIAREITLKDEWKVGRVIARPYIGDKKGNFKRTSNRHDYALKPYGETALNALKDKNFDVISVGKINDIFDGQGINKNIKANDNNEAINKLLDIMDKNFTGLCMVNLSDFDSLYGHPRDFIGYGRAIEELDVDLSMVLNKLDLDDLLIITADHGNDPTFKGNDHTRENVPVIIYSRNFKEPKRLKPFETFANIGATIADNFEVAAPAIGESILDELK